jgi:hypothetical protein
MDMRGGDQLSRQYARRRQRRHPAALRQRKSQTAQHTKARTKPGFTGA